MKRKETEKKGLPLNLQFFAESGEESKKDGEGNSDVNDDEDLDDNDDADDNKDDEKKFSQNEVSAMMTAEKKKGKRSILNALGVKSIEEAKSLMKKENHDDSNKDSKVDNSEELSKAQKRAMAAENKLSCVMAGVDKDSVDDVLAIALLKVSDDEDLDDVLEKMKNDKKYSTFFGKKKSESEDDGIDDKGTGSGSSKQKKKESNKNTGYDYGKQLAERAKKANETKKKSYFD